MSLAAPNYYAGALDPLRGAMQLFTSAGWIYRRCNEVLAETELDPVKLYDLASNCFVFRQEADKWLQAGSLTAVREELVKLTLSAGKGNITKTPTEINADYTQLYTESGNFLTWATANLPQPGQPVPNATVTVNRTWPSPDFMVRVPPPAAITNKVQTLRNVFD
jgi:hypothetical protein